MQQGARTDAVPIFVRKVNVYRKAIKNRGLERSLKMQIPKEVYGQLEEEMKNIDR